MNLLFGLLLVSLVFGTGKFNTTTSQNCEKCSGEIVRRTRNNLVQLTLEEVQTFFCTIEASCALNVEFTEFSNEVLYDLFKIQPDLSLTAMGSASENSRRVILDKLMNPIHDGIDLRSTYSNVEKVKGHKKVKKDVLNAIQIALDNNK